MDNDVEPRSALQLSKIAAAYPEFWSRVLRSDRGESVHKRFIQSHAERRCGVKQSMNSAGGDVIRQYQLRKHSWAGYTNEERLFYSPVAEEKLRTRQNSGLNNMALLHELLE